MSGMGDFLRRRRAEVRPEHAGLVSTGIRRVPGLRREEVALLAGVSADYYTRLEQGREQSPSAHVLEALSAALRLDDDARLHLFRLAGLAPRVIHAQMSEHVDPALARLLEAWPNNPALIYNRAYDVLALNPIAEALFDPMVNLMSYAFCDPAARTFYVDWDTVAANAVAGFRFNYVAAPHDSRVRAVLAELIHSSDEFRQLWTNHSARGKSDGSKSLHHHVVGRMTLSMQTFDVRSAPGQQIVVYHAEPGSPSADALTLLGSLAVSG